MWRESQIKNVKRPISLTVVGITLFFAGLAGVVSGCLQAHGFEISPSYNLFNMIAGVGLLKLWRGARLYSLIVIGFSIAFSLFSILFSLYVVFHPEHVLGHRAFIMGSDFEMSSPLVISIFTTYAALLGWMFRVLVRRDVRGLFQVRFA